MNFEQIMTSLRRREYLPVYFLMGEEPYFMDKISDYLAGSVLEESQRAFNQMMIYGQKDLSVRSVIESARRFPMMSPYQLVIVREAQQMGSLDDLAVYVENPQLSTLLVFCYRGKLDKRTKVYKSLSGKGYLFEFAKLYDNQLPEWIAGYVSGSGYKITPPAAVLLAEYAGNDLSKLANEVDKLIIFLGTSSNTITPELIERNVGVSKDYNNFELQEALTRGDVLKANRIIDHFAKNPKSNPMVLTLSSLYGFFMKIFILHALEDRSPANVAKELGAHPYFVKSYEMAAKRYPAKKISAIFSWLREYDLKIKGVGNVSSSEGDLLRELIFKILH
jgi:DNA polymerase-3 subunit delta